MTEKKTLNEEELNTVAGGDAFYELERNCFKTKEEIVFKYSIGYSQEICDFEGSLFTSLKRTHRATITKKGAYFYIYGWYPCYYFDGDSDVAGWYRESMIPSLEYTDCTDTYERNCGGLEIVEL